jgi:alpha-D-ribose 1-methylphosphonate 5-triphosphate synthase subunit PhnI
MYVASSGGEAAISAAHELQRLARAPRPGSAQVEVAQVIDQQWLAVSRVMNEGSLYDPELAAHALLQSQGDLVEAAFLLRAYRTTLPRFGTTRPIDTAVMRVRRRVSAAFKDVPGGQLLGATFDYSHRLLDNLATAGADRRTHDHAASDAEPGDPPQAIDTAAVPRVLDVLGRDGLIEQVAQMDEGCDSWALHDITREPIRYPAPRGARLQQLARGDEGFLCALAYSTQRGFGSTHPFAGEIRVGEVELWFHAPEIDDDIPIGSITVTECEMINQFTGSTEVAPTFTRGYGIGYGTSERRAMSMALVDRSLRAEELGEVANTPSPAQDQEFVLSHADPLEASGFVTHLRLPHYVDFQSELVMLRTLRAAWQEPNHPDRTCTAGPNTFGDSNDAR